MPNANWKGQITFGLVSIPIILVNAKDPKSTVSFKQINLKTGAKIKYKRVDESTGKEVPWDQIGKGYQFDKETLLPVKEGELERLAGDNAHHLVIEEFVDDNHLNYINVDKTYYVLPNKKGEKGYIILKEALKRAKKVGITKVIISTKEYLAAIAPFENALVLHLMHYEEEIRPLNDFDLPTNEKKKYQVSEKEIVIAQKLIQMMSAKWKPEKYKDEYKLTIEKWVKAKTHRKSATKMAPRTYAKKIASNKMDFIDLLKKSLKKSPKKIISSLAAKKKTQLKESHKPSRHRASAAH